MITIRITHDELNRHDMVNYLEHVANLVNSGYDKGEDWSIIGDEEFLTANTAYSDENEEELF